MRLFLSFLDTFQPLINGINIEFRWFDGHRFTRDADALAVSIPKEKLEKLIPKALLADLNDGMWYGECFSCVFNAPGLTHPC